MLREARSDVPSEILPGLFLGNGASSANARFFRHANITRVINCTDSLPNQLERTAEYHRVPVEDSIDADLLAHLDDALDVIARSRSRGDGVLVHCQQGVSRSASVVIAFCMREHGMDLREALQHVHQRRWVRPNEGFLMQLQTWHAAERRAADDSETWSEQHDARAKKTK